MTMPAAGRSAESFHGLQLGQRIFFSSGRTTSSRRSGTIAKMRLLRSAVARAAGTGASSIHEPCPRPLHDDIDGRAHRLLGRPVVHDGDDLAGVAELRPGDEEVVDVPDRVDGGVAEEGPPLGSGRQDPAEPRAELVSQVEPVAGDEHLDVRVLRRELARRASPALSGVRRFGVVAVVLRAPHRQTRTGLRRPAGAFRRGRSGAVRRSAALSGEALADAAGGVAGDGVAGAARPPSEGASSPPLAEGAAATRAGVVRDGDRDRSARSSRRRRSRPARPGARTSRRATRTAGSGAGGRCRSAATTAAVTSARLDAARTSGTTAVPRPTRWTSVVLFKPRPRGPSPPRRYPSSSRPKRHPCSRSALAPRVAASWHVVRSSDGHVDAARPSVRRRQLEGRALRREVDRHVSDQVLKTAELTRTSTGRSSDRDDREGRSSPNAVDAMNRLQAPRLPAGRRTPHDRTAAATSAPTTRGTSGNRRRTPDAPAHAAHLRSVSSALGFIAAARLAAAPRRGRAAARARPSPGPSTEGASPPEPNVVLSPPRALGARRRVRRGAQARPRPPAPSECPGAPAPDKPYTGPLLGSRSRRRRRGLSDDGVLQAAARPHPARRQGAGRSEADQGRELRQGLVTASSTALRLREVGHDGPLEPAGPPRHHAAELDDVLPDKYAFNTTHGTPLYRSVPSKDEMTRYEPYLESSKRKRKEEEKQRAEALYEETEKEVAAAAAARAAASAEAAASPAPVAAVAADPVAVEDKAAAVAAAAPLGIAPAPSKRSPRSPGGRNVDEKGRPLNVTLADLDKDADSTVAKRMVKGFFVAVDKTFGWNGRSWYKTTAAPRRAERPHVHHQAAGLAGHRLPRGREVGRLHPREVGEQVPVRRREEVRLRSRLARSLRGVRASTGESHTHKSTVYRKTTEGWWMKGADGTYTDLGAPPPDLAPGEKWIDVQPVAQDAGRDRGRQARLRGAHPAGEALEGQEEGPPHAHGGVPHPREARRDHDGRRRHGRGRSAVQLSRTFRSSRITTAPTPSTAPSGTETSAGR